MSELGTSKRKRRGGPRRKTGCHTCKARHSRCDEKKPVCSNCERLNLECKQSDFIAPSSWNNTPSEPTPPAPTPALQVTMDEMQLLPVQAQESPERTLFMNFEQPASTWDIFRTRIDGLDQVSDESPPNDVFTQLNLAVPRSPMLTSPSSLSPEAPVSLTAETAFLLQTYLRTVARWMDLMCHSSTYQLIIPKLTLTSPLLFHCVCAFTAKYLALSNRRSTNWDSTARHHYGLGLHHLIHALNTPNHQHALTATILLSSYEIIAGIASEHHRRHILGQTMLIKHHNINAQSTGMDKANFWIHVRHEIGFAQTTGRPLILDPEEWNVHWEEGETREDVLGNHVLWILARVLCLIYGDEGSAASGKRKRIAFLQELEEWRSSLSDTFIGIPYGEADAEGFRKVYFTVTAAAAAAFWYHVTHILLYAEPTLQDESYTPLIQDQAMRLTNIAISEFPDSLRVFATHGLFFAAKHIQGIARKARIWNILNDVEAELGYHTRSMVKRLQDLVEQGS
ncbi:uncharacterized protein CC84DRAFT_167455 [Paraphaeosphaeria sporulosa]|uniref:Zn(2)-C6 fungal-type domain-containing protein n=1 Tax=Paraphaeosphaeria sporulosa TaxID=1460663 RepID=A0A177D1F5_9PLEO|nr:uncharacterized protein CC84DRAFT_167455 [Paraphaeosphaeria sporulosa]OAG12960.1 hypothetical protein CC84DRAFT_167455 [Paraphaeosphaeria sporulosa]